MAFLQKYMTTGHTRHGIKVGLASVLAYWFSDLIGLPYAYWAVVSTVIVMQIQVSDSIHMCLYRFTGTAIGAVIGIAAIVIFPATHYYTLLGIFITTGLCAYLTRYHVRFRMAAITVSIVYLTAMQDDGRILFALYRVGEIGVGVLSAFLVSVFIWPNRTGLALRERIEKQYDELADHYLLIMGNFLSLQKKTDPDLLFDLAVETKNNREMFHKVYAHERRFFRDDVQLLSMQVSALNSSIERVQAMLVLLNEVDGKAFDIIMAPELMELTRATGDALRAIGTGTPHDPHRLAAACDATERRFLELRPQGVTERFQYQRLFQVLGFINASQHLGEYVLSILNSSKMPKE
ncbi:FUSC family protein [Pseudodesulfovibrio sp. zrk46]|uniref:FUSC family protein n=1 Tax=Pseudodesulfovibrio sp. zrk46 TaxID=2725288 RepID=UPI00144990F6|nr:FUSC family protein [Pseudodesulfovibrio sp. zrk46]QJB56729.1 FUSC family protein [Pseudodesulfovibrio sp. zrk46]